MVLQDPQRYQLLEAVGLGATARVFRCADQQGKVLAVKRTPGWWWWWMTMDEININVNI